MSENSAQAALHPAAQGMKTGPNASSPPIDMFVQLPLSASALRKWTRFAEKGGIGKAVGKLDKLAEPDTDQLMFMEGEELVVLMQLSDGLYLGCCEGVVGVFHDQDVQIIGKLKRPVFTKSSSSSSSPHRKRRSASKSPASASPRTSLGGRHSKAFTTTSSSSRPASTSTARGDRNSNATLKSYLPPQTPSTNNGQRAPLESPSDGWPKEWGDSSATQAEVNLHAPNEYTAELSTSFIQNEQDIRRQPVAREVAVPSTAGGIEQPAATQPRIHKPPLLLRQDSQSAASETTDDFINSYRDSVASEASPASSQLPYTTSDLVFPQPPTSESEPGPSSSSSPPNPQYEAREEVAGQRGAYSTSSEAPSAEQSDTEDWSDTKDHGVSGVEDTAFTASLLRRRMEENSVRLHGLRLEAPLQIRTKSPLSALADNLSGKAAGHTQVPSLSSSIDSPTSPVSSLRSPTHPTMPNLPKGVSLKQLRSSPGTSYSFPRRSPGGPKSNNPVNARRNVSSPNIRSSPGFRQQNEQHVQRSANASPHLSPTESTHAPNVQVHASFDSSPTETRSFPSRQVSQPHLQPFPHGGDSSPTASSTYSYHEPRHFSAQLHSGHYNRALRSPSLKSPVSPDQTVHWPEGPPSPSRDGPSMHWSSLQRSMTSSSNDAHSIASSSTSHKLFHSKSFTGMGNLVRGASLRSRRRPSLPDSDVDTGVNKGGQSDVRSERSLDSPRGAGDSVVQLGRTEFEFVLPSLPKPQESAALDSSVSSSASQSTRHQRPPWETEDDRDVRSPEPEVNYATDYETDEEGASYASRFIVTNPSQAARDRVKSMYIDNQFVEPSQTLDKHGFFASSGGPEEESRPLDAKALEAYRARELKWVSTMNSSTPHAAKRSKKVKKLVSYGIPNSVRGKAWAFLAETESHKRQGLYHELCSREDPPCTPEIEKDLSRTFPDHPHFSDENSLGRVDLSSVLKAFAHYTPEVGYCQGLCFIVGTLLLHTEAETAFWLLVSLTRTHLKEYYTKEMKGFRTDSLVLGRLIKNNETKLYKKFQEAGIQTDMFASGWLLPLFVRILPWSSLLRIIDLLLYSDPPSKFLIRVALSILDLTRDHLLSASKDVLLPILLRPSMDLLGPASLVPTVLTVKIPERTLKKYGKQAETTLATLARSNGQH